MDESVANIFTRGSHHRNVSVILLVQNLFHKNKHVRTISLNSHYLVLYKNPRDASQIANLFRQMYLTRWRFAVEAYKNATRELPESHVTWITSVPILVFQGLCVLELDPMYATDRQTDVRHA